MGEAKRRGTFEQRKAEGIIKEAKKAAERQAMYEARMENIEKLRKARILKEGDRRRPNTGKLSAFTSTSAFMLMAALAINPNNDKRTP